MKWRRRDGARVIGFISGFIYFCAAVPVFATDGRFENPAVNMVTGVFLAMITALFLGFLLFLVLGAE
jgi:hypothetical protein